MKKVLTTAAVVFTAAFLMCNHASASTIIVDAKTGEKYESIDDALKENVVHEDDIKVTIPATKNENEQDYNKIDHDSEVETNLVGTPQLSPETKVKQDAVARVTARIGGKGGFVVGACAVGVILVLSVTLVLFLRKRNRG